MAYTVMVCTYSCSSSQLWPMKLWSVHRPAAAYSNGLYISDRYGLYILLQQLIVMAYTVMVCTGHLPAAASEAKVQRRHTSNLGQNARSDHGLHHKEGGKRPIQVHNISVLGIVDGMPIPAQWACRRRCREQICKERSQTSSHRRRRKATSTRLAC